MNLGISTTLKRCSRRGCGGFTLIEVMITALIIAVLAAVALPSYRAHVIKSQRIDAKETLLRMATLQERHFFQYSRYTTELADIGGTLSPEGWYDINMFHDGCNDDGCSDFRITAKVKSGGAQADDKKCDVFSIDETLNRTALDDQGASSNDCW